MIPFLKPGDQVGLAATARKVSPEEMAPAISFLEGWGLKVVTAANLYKADRQFAGTDDERAAGLQQLLDDPNIKAVLCARGGYGTVRIIDRLRFEVFQKHPKWVIGFSDLTLLHTHTWRHFHLPMLHGPMAITMQPHNADTESTEALRRMLFGEKMQYQVKPDELNREGSAKAELIGGNLSVLYSTLGSASDTDTRGKILFLEDLDEYLYHIDRMMIFQ